MEAQKIKCVLPPKMTGTRWFPHMMRGITSFLWIFRVYEAHLSSLSIRFLKQRVARVVSGQAYRGLSGGFLLLRIFSDGISVSPHVCFILDLVLISMFLR